jgi:poly(hydroxyalkanoate) depolymerase family esterase
MDRERMNAMAEATALTRAGRLAEATALIRRTVSGAPSAMHHRPPAAPDRGLPESPGSPESPDDIALPAGPALPGETTARTHRGVAGARPYLLHVPATGTGPRPLVVLLHGGTQTAAEIATATRIRELAEEHGFLVACPEQSTSANPMRYWNWFQPGDQVRGAGEPAILAGIVEDVAAAHEVDRDRVYVAGFSAGAAMAAVLGATYPDVFAAVGVHSGLPRGCAHDVASAFEAMRATAPAAPLRRPVPVIVFHGDDDPTVAAGNATLVVEQFTAGPARGDTVVERGPGRPATRTVVRRSGVVVAEQWTVHGSGHAWSGGVAGASYTDPAGPDASAEMLRFFAEHPRRS